MKRKRIVKVKGEGFLKKGILIFFGIFLASNFILSATAQMSNAELQRMKSKLESQEKMNQSMQMKINELASLDNAMEIASTYGLEYKNNNIKVITDEE
ncbi:MAG: hypothetical protein IJB83_05010 [Bacilli bacterium]|nr:hypothetical protein [Bacilli bacterium]